MSKVNLDKLVDALEAAARWNAVRSAEALQSHNMAKSEMHYAIQETLCQIRDALVQ